MTRGFYGEECLCSHTTIKPSSDYRKARRLLARRPPLQTRQRNDGTLLGTEDPYQAQLIFLCPSFSSCETALIDALIGLKLPSTTPNNPNPPKSQEIREFNGGRTPGKGGGGSRLTQSQGRDLIPVAKNNKKTTWWVEEEIEADSDSSRNPHAHGRRIDGDGSERLVPRSHRRPHQKALLRPHQGTSRSGALNPTGSRPSGWKEFLSSPLTSSTPR